MSEQASKHYLCDHRLPASVLQNQLAFRGTSSTQWKEIAEIFRGCQDIPSLQRKKAFIYGTESKFCGSAFWPSQELEKSLLLSGQ